MIRIGAIKVFVSNCITGVYLRWWYNGWHYFNFTNGYEIQMNTESMGTQTTRYFSVISKIERPTRLKAEYSYQISLEGIYPKDIGGFVGLLIAEKVMQLESGIWREVDITRGDHAIRFAGENGYVLNFEITRKELPVTSAVYQKSLKLYVGDVLCDLDDDEVVPINKQTNDIAEMQDRQADFTSQFKVRKTRAMKALFELSGETGIDTDFPFVDKTCKLIQDNIEVITNGELILDKVDDQYYYVAILSGNKSFFKAIEKLKLSDLTLASTDHTWDVATMVGTHAADLDYVYPLCEPSDDGGLTPPLDDGDMVELFGGWIWCFVKAKAIWDEIFSNAGFMCEGDILTDLIFTKLHLPLVNLNVQVNEAYLYSKHNHATNDYWAINNRMPGGHLIKGDAMFLNSGVYSVPYTATYTMKILIRSTWVVAGSEPQIFVVDATTLAYTYFPIKSRRMIPSYRSRDQGEYIYEGEVSAITPTDLYFYITTCVTYYWDITVVSISNAKLAYGSDIVPRINLPNMTQIDFVKMISNMFGLIPEVIPRDRKITFWNYLDLYYNIPNARDWSAYLSERDDEMEFKFGDYAQNNYFHYKESEDVVAETGVGTMEIDDDTLQDEKDVIELPVSTCEEVEILNNIFGVNVSRINFNVYDADTDTYKANESIDPRIVYVDHCKEVASPPYEKTLRLRTAVPPAGAATDITSPKIATSLEVSFPYLLASYYSGISRMLTKTNLRRAKFNLPVYEVAGLKHYIPIYLSQYKAYFYVNKINNYVAGQLCTIELIKL